MAAGAAGDQVSEAGAWSGTSVGAGQVDPALHAASSNAALPTEPVAPPVLLLEDGPAHQNEPTDQDVLDLQNIIRAEEAQRRPHIGTKEPLSHLKEEYMYGSEVFVKKIEALEATYTHVRRARGDGNCFFKSFVFSYLEFLMTVNNTELTQRFASTVQSCKKKLLDSGYQELVFEDAMDLLLQQVDAIDRVKDPLTLDVLHGNFCDDTVSSMVVMYLRMLTAAEILQRQEFFAPFILGLQDEVQTVEQFCRRFVEPMGEESDHVHIVALADALGIAVRVIYLDSHGSGDSLVPTHHDFIPDGTPQQRRAWQGMTLARSAWHAVEIAGHYFSGKCSRLLVDAKILAILRAGGRSTWLVQMRP